MIIFYIVFLWIFLNFFILLFFYKIKGDDMKCENCEQLKILEKKHEKEISKLHHHIKNILMYQLNFLNHKSNATMLQNIVDELCFKGVLSLKEDLQLLESLRRRKNEFN